MTAKDAAVVRPACSLDESSTASKNNSKHATQNIAPAAKPSPICVVICFVFVHVSRQSLRQEVGMHARRGKVLSAS